MSKLGTKLHTIVLLLSQLTAIRIQSLRRRGPHTADLTCDNLDLLSNKVQEVGPALDFYIHHVTPPRILERTT